jgi:ABC-type glycerol-3-phosphate transport system substrate-binding protein
MKNSNLFQYIVIGAFVFFIIIGAILFSTYKSKNQQTSNISIAIWGTLPADSFSSFYSRYFSENDLKYNVSYEAKSRETLDQDLVEAIASGVGPDAIILPEDLIVRFSNKIYPIPYTTISELQFKQTFIQEGELYLTNSGILALPFTVDPLVMYWNRSIFNNASITKIPTTWTEVYNLVPKIVKKDAAQNLSRSAVALGEYRNVTNAKDILSAMIIQSVNKLTGESSSLVGNPIVNRSAESVFSSTLKDNFGSKSNPAITALTFFTNFSNSSKPEYSWNRSLPNSIDAFTNGDLALYFGFASEFIQIKNKNPNLNFSVALLPQLPDTKINSTLGNMLGFAILKNSKDPAGAFTVLSSLTNVKAFPYWKDIFNIPSARRDILSQVEPNAIKTVFNTSAIMSNGWFDPNGAQTSLIFQEMIESYTTGRESLDSAVSNASDRIDKILSGK